jgi:hypothetical protein
MYRILQPAWTFKSGSFIAEVRKYCGDSHMPFTYTMKVRRFVEREHHRQSMHGHMVPRPPWGA